MSGAHDASGRVACRTTPVLWDCRWMAPEGDTVFSTSSFVMISATLRSEDFFPETTTFVR